MSLADIFGFGEADLDPGSLPAATQGLIEESRNNLAQVQSLRDQVQRRILQLESDEEPSGWQDVLLRRREICVLKNTHNALAPISSLPTEVLCTIFLLHRHHPLPVDSTWAQVSSLDMTHVCRLWRSVAVECAELWTTIDCSKSPDFVQMMLRRSKEAPLAIKFDMNPHTMGSNFSLFRRCLRRLSSIELRCTQQDDTFGVSNALSHLPASTPMLEKVEIFARNYSATSSDDIPDSFLQGSNPNLKFLHIAGRIHWTVLPSAPCLTSLTLYHTCGSQRVGPGLAAGSFIEFLHEAHKLEQLHISHFLPSDMYPPQSISLCQLSLQHLHIEDKVPFITNFLTSIKTIAAFQISINVLRGNPPTPFIDHLSECFSALSRVWVGSPNSNRTRSGIRTVTLYTWVPVRRSRIHPQLQCSFGEEAQCSELRVRFFGGALSTHESLQGALVAVTEPFGQLEISSLSLDDCYDPPELTWESMLRLMPNLKRITLADTRSFGFVGVVGRPDSVSLCTALSHVHILHNDSGDVYWAEKFSASIFSLAELLAKRAETPSPIEELRVGSRSRIHRDTYQRLMAFSPALNIVTERLKAVDK